MVTEMNKNQISIEPRIISDYMNTVSLVISRLCHGVYARGDSMISDFTDRRPLPVRDYVVSIENGPKL